MRSVFVAVLLTACGVAAAGVDPHDAQPAAPTAASPAEPASPAADATPAEPAAKTESAPRLVTMSFHDADVEDVTRFFSDVLGRPIDVGGAARGRRFDLDATLVPAADIPWVLDQGLKAQGLALWEGERRLSIGVLGPPPGERAGTLVVSATDGDAAKLGRIVDRLWRGQVKVAHRGERLAIRGELTLLDQVQTHLRDRDLVRASPMPTP